MIGAFNKQSCRAQKYCALQYPFKTLSTTSLALDEVVTVASSGGTMTSMALLGLLLSFLHISQ